MRGTLYTLPYWEKVGPMTTYLSHPHIHTPTKAPPRGQTRFGNKVPPEAEGVNSCTEGCVLWSHEKEGRREGRSLRPRWIRRRKMGRGGQDTDKKTKDDPIKEKKQKM